MSKAMRRRISDASPSLPEDLVAEILSWLPVESVLRFKCVCKSWGQFIQQDDFVQKHLRRSAMGCYHKKEYIYLFCPEFSCFDMQKGLLLAQEYRNDHTGRLYICNPATRQRVYLPDLQVGYESPTWFVARMFFVAKSINECTVISFSQSKESVLSGRFRAITVGVDTTWRPLKNSPHNSMQCISIPRHWASGGPNIFVLSIEKIFHVVTLNGHEGNIMSVDVEDESIKTTKIPENLFSDWRNVLPREWNSKLSLFSDDGYQINTWVLMDNNKNQWTKIQTIYLAPPTQDVYALSFRFVNQFLWSVHRPELSTKPSILQLKGMQSESEGLSLERNR